MIHRRNSIKKINSYVKQLCFLCVLMFSLVVFSQNKENEFQDLAPEKIYLQLDSNVYTTNSNIWFKAIVTNATNHTPSVLSGVLYVELIAPDEKIIEAKRIKLTNGQGNNFFELQKNLPQGKYLIRAYTEWNKNFDENFTFKSYLDIFSTLNKNSEGIITNVILKENEPGEFSLNAELKPQLLDSLQKNKLIVYLVLDNKKDTVVVKSNSDRSYLLDYALSSDVDLATLTIETENHKRYIKTIALKENRIDLQFFPEGGEMVHSLQSKIGFKATNYDGKGIVVEGNIVDNDNKIITSFKSNSLGMGVFYLQGNRGKMYYAKLSHIAEVEASQKYQLPEAVTRGSVLSITKLNEKIKITVASNNHQAEKIVIKVSSRGIDYYLIDGVLKNGKLRTFLNKSKVPEGILAFTLINSENKPIAERLYFNERQETRLNIQASSDKNDYTNREKSEIQLTVLNAEGKVEKTNLSFLVLNKDVLGKMQNTRTNIISYFLLDSELRGSIESPSNYFNPENQHRLNDMDALLLTQGWRKYKYSKPLKNKELFKNEPQLRITGRVGMPLSETKKKSLDLTMMTSGETSSFFSQKTDSLGRFNFQLDDEFGEQLKILIQSKNASGKRKDYPILLDKKELPKVQYNHKKSIQKLDSVVLAYVVKEQKYSAKEAAFVKSQGVTYLDEVVVEDRKLTPLQKKVTIKYGEADVVIKGEDILSNEKKWSYGLYSVLLFYFPRDIYIETFSDGFMLAHVLGGGEATLVMVDGELVLKDDYDLIPNIPPSEVKSFELIKYAKKFISAYIDVFPRAHPADPDVPKTGNIISIYTHGNVGLQNISKPKGQFKTSIPVFSPTKEFYAPKYDDVISKQSRNPDLRSVIHWIPQLEVNEFGKASATFYNADVSGEMIVIVEAISEDGEIGYKELTYKVKGEGIK